MISQAKLIVKSAKAYIIISILLSLILFLPPAVVLSQAETFCPPGQTPHFIFGFAFLKSQLGDIMGEPLECEHYDEAGNAFQKTTTGQAYYIKDTNTPLFTSGNKYWAWTPQGLEHGVEPPAAPVNATPSPSASPTSLRVMSYNILFGAGAVPSWEQRAADLRPFSYPGNRLPAVLSVIKAAEPDILGIQEVAGWENETPSITQQVADELGMSYFLAESPSGLNLLLLTKLEIIETENLSDQIGNVGALRATLALPDDPQPLIHVFVVHLDPFSATTRTEQVSRLIQEMNPYLFSPTILMGDTNIDCVDQPEQCQEYQLLSSAGWQLVVKEQYLINQIWASPMLSESIDEIIFPNATFDISDHLPVGAVIEVIPVSED